MQLPPLASRHDFNGRDDPAPQAVENVSGLGHGGFSHHEVNSQRLGTLLLRALAHAFKKFDGEFLALALGEYHKSCAA
jgi:hypothetical protein